MSDFILDARLDADSLPVADLRLSALRLAKDAHYPWLILVPRRAGCTEIIDLDDDDRRLLIDEIADVSRALRMITGCDKLNVGALGNQVSQLHVHVIARFRADPAWPHPVWGRVQAAAYAPEARDALIARLSAELG